MTPDQVRQAYALLAQLDQLNANEQAFSNAANFQISAINVSGGTLANATFPASGYAAAIAAAFAAQANAITTQLTNLGVTGL